PRPTRGDPAWPAPALLGPSRHATEVRHLAGPGERQGSASFGAALVRAGWLLGRWGRVPARFLGALGRCGTPPDVFEAGAKRLPDGAEAGAGGQVTGGRARRVRLVTDGVGGGEAKADHVPGGCLDRQGGVGGPD